MSSRVAKRSSSPKSCCVRCFRNEEIQSIIRSEKNRGACGCCGERRTWVTNPYSLHDAFAQLLTFYSPTEHGKHYHKELDSEAFDVGDSLAAKLGEWDIFSPRLSLGRQNDLLDVIRGVEFSNPQDGDYFTPSSELWSEESQELWHRSDEDLWAEFVHHLCHKRRFILQESELEFNPRKAFPPVFKMVERTIALRASLYRSRVGTEDDERTPYPADKMGMPPSELVLRGGRANAPGIAVLYLAFEEQTAVAEVRPNLVEALSVARYRPQETLRVVDLSVIPKFPEIFQPNFRQRLWAHKMLHILHRQLSTPVSEHTAAIDYVPTQYLAELIASLGYDGIKFQSSLVRNGKNLVLFTDRKVKITRTYAVRAVDLGYTVQQVPGSLRRASQR